MRVYNHLQFLDIQLRLKKLKSLAQDCTGSPGGSAAKESACNAGSISRSERSPEEGIGYLPQYSWASLVAQTGKNPLAMWETWVPSLAWEDPLEEGIPSAPPWTCGVSTNGRPEKSLQTILWLNPSDAQVSIKLINCLNFRQQTYLFLQTLPPMD